MSDPPRQATAYARVSTEDQADEGSGIAAQIDVATAAIAERDWVLVAEVVDAGVSGSVAPERRPALGPALAALDGAGAGAGALQAIADRLAAEGISTPRGGPWRTSNVDGILRSLRLDAEAAQTTAPRSSAGPPAAVEILGNEIATAAEPDRHQAARSGPRALAGR